MSSTETQCRLFFVSMDIGAHHAQIVSVLDHERWSNDNPSVVTDQHLYHSPNAHLSYTMSNREEAEEFMAEFLKCDSVETGRYCYSHNRYPNEK